MPTLSCLHTEHIGNKPKLVPMVKLAVCSVLFVSMLSACSDNTGTVSVDGVDVDAGVQEPVSTPQPGSDVGQPEPVPTPTGEPSVIQSDASFSPLPPGTRAQVYTGLFDSGEGVFLLDDDSRLLGLLTDADNSVRSVRLDLSDTGPSTGLVRQFQHRTQASEAGMQVFPFAESALSGVDATMAIIDGQSINSLTTELPVSLSVATANELLPISSNSVQGSWTGSYSFCDSLGQNCVLSLLQFDITGDVIDGTASLIAADGTNLLPSDLTGSIEQRGSVVDVVFRWNTYNYSGFAFVDSANTSQLMLVATTNSEIADERTLAVSLNRLL
ncbi:MAG: hypothetical protein AB8B79_15800 [Granulosicoccus sp.]